MFLIMVAGLSFGFFFAMGTARLTGGRTPVPLVGELGSWLLASCWRWEAVLGIWSFGLGVGVGVDVGVDVDVVAGAIFAG
jgi:hypothetical protein